MKKRLLLVAILMMLFIPTVNASNICTQKKFNELKQKASKVKVEWKLKFEDEDTDDYYFEISISNVDKDLVVKANGIYYEPDEGNIVLDSKLTGGNTYDIQFYGGFDHVCVEQYIFTKKIKVPLYNKYYKMKECETYKEFPLCDQWYNGVIINEEDFYAQLEEYKSKIENGEIVIEKEKDDNTLIIVAVLAVVVVAIAAGYFFATNKKTKNNEKKEIKK